VETDRPIKVLFERQGQSLLPFIGERQTDVRVTAVESLELPVSKRTIDSVLRLERDGLVWYRHLEFQAPKDADIPRRCFEYNSRLILHYGAAVLTTVLYLLPGADEDVARQPLSPQSRPAIGPRRSAPGPCSARSCRMRLRDARRGKAPRAGRPLAGHPPVTAFLEAPLTGRRTPRRPTRPKLLG
jgi:hypothetical protein